MVDKLGLGTEPKELKLGASFTNKGIAFHTFRYDFKPASVDTTKMATVDVLPNNEVTVTVPHCDGAGTAHTVFRGPKKPYSKECVLIIDHSTGEVTLERLSQTLQLKKTRAGTSKSARAMSPVEHKKNSSPLHSKTSPNSSSSPAAMSPVYRNPLEQQQQQPARSSPKHSAVVGSSWKQKSIYSPQAAPSITARPASSMPSLPGSMPIISLDDIEPSQPHQQSSDVNDMLGVISDSSSNSDSSSGSSDSDDSDAEMDSKLVSILNTSGGESPPPQAATPRETLPLRRETGAHGHLSMPNLLSEDLQLSESGSDSD
nr:EOG090X0IV9 [Eulimnadia texana]